MSMIYVDKAHAGNILQQLWEDCENEDLCDVVLIAGNENLRIPAHRNILSAASEYFKGMFQSSMRESTTKDIKMSSANGAILRSLIEYCYIGRVAITEENAVELLKLADSLLLSNVVTACGNFLSEQLHPNNCLGLELFAEQYRCEILLKKAKDYSLKHFMDVSKTQEFLSLNSEQLGEFLANDNLCVTAEEKVFQILMTWVQHDQIEREKYQDKLLKLVRLPLLERSFLIEQVKPICTSMESLHLYIEAIEKKSLPYPKILNARKSIVSDKSLICLTINSNNSGLKMHFYCPQRLKWMSCLKDLEYRSEFGATVMDDKLYVVGGLRNGDVLSSVICINLETMTKGQITPMTERRYRCGAAVLNEFLYAVGGINAGGTFSTAERWDPKTNTWSKVASMSQRRSDFGIAQLNQKLYAIGGTCGGSCLNSAEYYDEQQNVWKSIAPMNEHHRSAGVAVAKGLLYVVSDNNSFERYDPQRNNWTTLCRLPISNNDQKYCTTFCNKVVVCCNDQFYEYNDKTNEWTLKDILNGIKNVRCLVAYSGELPISEWFQN